MLAARAFPTTALRDAAARSCHRLLNRHISATARVSDDIRTRLTSELKNAMKARDTMKSTTIRSVLSEVYAADKAPGREEPAPALVIVNIVAKAVQRRRVSASEFEKASRADLADKERREAELLQTFLPPLLSGTDIDRILVEVLTEQPEVTSGGSPKKVKGALLKSFYTKIDRSTVTLDTDLVNSKIEQLMSSSMIPVSD